MKVYRDRPEKVADALDYGIMEVVFAFFLTWLSELGIDENDAALWFLIDYTDAKILYLDSVLATIGKKVATANSKKYDKLIAVYKAEYNPLENYDRTESSTHTRTPTLTTSASQTATGSATNNNTQTTANTQKQTTKTTPSQGYKLTTTQKVAPFDTGTMQNQTETDQTQSGHLETETSYSGNPDTQTNNGTTTSSTSGTTTTTETGTDVTEIHSSIHGNVGVTSSQQMATQELELAAKMAIWKIIEKDVASAILLQVW